MDAFIVSARRTPIGRFGGSLASVAPVELGRVATVAALADAGVAPAEVDGLILGMARQAGNGPNPARQVALGAGLRHESWAFTLNQACASGMLAIVQARDLIRLGEAHVIVAAGSESMSRVPHLLESETARWGTKMGTVAVVDGMTRDGFFCPLADQLMGRTAETLAARDGLTRRDQDEYAVRSQRLCAEAQAAGRFDGEIAPVAVRARKGEITVSRDEHPRQDATVEGMASLPPVFLSAAEGGTVHAGNSSGITDGAAALVVMSERAVKERGVTPLARIAASTVAGVDPRIMGIGPVPATRALLAATGLSLADIDLIELNEAFAAQVLACVRELGLPLERMNVNGGAIALGHPIGCTGARITTTLIHEMKRRGSRRGLATLCVSGGLGHALLLERT